MSPVITGVTNKKTIHGNPGERRVLPAGVRVNLVPADNLPADSKIRWWAHPRDGRPEWPADTREWAESVGVGLEVGDVQVSCYAVGVCLSNAATAYDRRERDRSDKAKAAGKVGHYSPHALPQYLARIDQIVADMCRGARPREAVLRGFCGRMGDALLKALGLPLSNKAERCRYVGLVYRPATDPEE